MNKNQRLFIEYIVTNLLMLNEAYSKADVERLTKKFKDQADAFNIKGKGGTNLTEDEIKAIIDNFDKLRNTTNKSDINKFNDTNQNALVLGDPKKVQQDKSHWNRTDSFFKGLYGDGKTGHIYAGNGIDHVNSIKSVKEIVEYLTSEL